MTEPAMRVIDAAAIRERIDLHAAIDHVQAGLRAAHAGRFSVPQRLVAADGRALAMVAARDDDPGVVWKVLTSVPGNAARGIPTIHGRVLWADDESGSISSMLDGEAVTALRTGAVTGLATRLLAASDAARMGMLGAGAQAADQVRGVLAVRPIAQVSIWSRRLVRAEALASRLAAEFPDVAFAAVPNVASAVHGMDVLSAATPAIAPLIHGHDLAPHALVNVIGSYRPTMVELAPSVFARAAIVTADDVAAALAESGDLIAARDAGVLRAEEVRALGGVEPGGAYDGIRVFCSVGSAVLDWALAAAVHRDAEEKCGASPQRCGDESKGMA